MFNRLINLFLVGFVIYMGGCGDSTTSSSDLDGGIDSDTSQSQENTLASLKITTGSILLTEILQTKKFLVTGYNSAGLELPLGDIVWFARDEQVASIDSQGEVTAVKIGSTTLVASVGEITSPPITILVARPSANSLLITDTQIESDPILVEPDATFDVGMQYTVTLNDLDTPPEPGTIVLATETKPVAGKVVSATEENGKVVVTLEVVPITELFDELIINETLALSQSDFELPADVSAAFDVTASGEGHYEFTPKNVDNLLQQNLRINVGSGVLQPIFKCISTVPGLINQGGAPLIKFELASPSISLDTDLSLPIVYNSQEGGLQKLALQGKVKVAAKLKNTIAVQFEAKYTCKVQLLQFRIPFPGVLAALVGAKIPLGFGVELAGKITLADIGFTLEASAEVNAEYGLDCTTGECDLKGDITAKGETKLDVNLPPDVSDNTLSDVKIQPSLSAFGYVELNIGNPYFSAVDVNLAEVRGGPKLSADLALIDAQVADASYASVYRLDLEFIAKAGTGILAALRLMSVPPVTSLELKHTVSLTSSPKAEKLEATLSDFSLNDNVDFTVKLNPSTVNFEIGKYNVESVTIYKLNSEGGLTEILSQDASNNQLEFNFSWIADAAGQLSIKDNGQDKFFFHAFVTTSMLPIPYLGMLELGPIKPPLVGTVTAMSGSSTIDMDALQECHGPNEFCDNNAETEDLEFVTYSWDSPATYATVDQNLTVGVNGQYGVCTGNANVKMIMDPVQAAPSTIIKINIDTTMDSSAKATGSEDTQPSTISSSDMNSEFRYKIEGAMPYSLDFTCTSVDNLNNLQSGYFLRLRQFNGNVIVGDVFSFNDDGIHSVSGILEEGEYVITFSTTAESAISYRSSGDPKLQTIQVNCDIDFVVGSE